MVYVCSLDINEKGNHEYSVCRTVEELYKLILNENAKEIVIKDDFQELYFTSIGLETLIKETRRLNPRLDIHTYQQKPHLGHKIHEMGDSNAIGLINANEKISHMHHQVSAARRLSKKEQQRADAYKSLLNTLQIKLDKVLPDGEKLESPSIAIKEKAYKRIIYIKEITRVRFMDTFLYYLQEVIRFKRGVSSPLVVIESHYADHKKYLYPYADLYMAGINLELLKGFMVKAMDTPFLIILDRSGLKEPCLKGEVVEVFYTVSDLNDLTLSLPFNKIISYEDSTLYVPHKKGFNALSSKEKIDYYTSMKTMKYFLRLLEVGE
ncbi:hypothetical protein [Vallitalea okinawensis]|uniref:hypothetical protein n=1 Tax=Vallitalea okinawensis TaxID=2078660 RepID=UPI000CFD8250|nr:hypothetical protein [Vallitalea okinawensis]